MRGISFVRHGMSAAVISFALSACTVTETIGNILGSTRDFLSSTSPGDWFTGDGVLKGDRKVIAFVAINFNNLKRIWPRDAANTSARSATCLASEKIVVKHFSHTLNPATRSQRTPAAAQRNW